MLLDLEHQLVDDAVHVFEDGFPGYILLDLLGILRVETPVSMYLGDIFEAVVEVFVVEFQRTYGFHFLFAILVYAESDDLLLMLHTSVLLPLTHSVSIFSLLYCL